MAHTNAASHHNLLPSGRRNRKSRPRKLQVKGVKTVFIAYPLWLGYIDHICLCRPSELIFYQVDLSVRAKRVLVELEDAHLAEQSGIDTRPSRASVGPIDNLWNKLSQSIFPMHPFPLFATGPIQCQFSRGRPGPQQGCVDSR